MITKTTLHRLTPDLVEIDSEKYVELNGAEVKLDIPKHSTSYVNSPSGRERLQSEQPGNVAASVLAMWGDTPTMADPEPPQPQEATPLNE